MTSPAVLMKAWKLYPKKQLGQNFLTDANMAEAIVNYVGLSSDDLVLEIGAGLGSPGSHNINRTIRRVHAQHFSPHGGDRAGNFVHGLAAHPKRHQKTADLAGCCVARHHHVKRIGRLFPA